MKPTVYAIAKALVQQHDFDFDVAFLSAWYGSGNSEIPEKTIPEIASRIDKVKWVPAITEAEAERMRKAYAEHQMGHHCPACEQSARLRDNAMRQLKRKGG